MSNQYRLILLFLNAKLCLLLPDLFPMTSPELSFRLSNQDKVLPPDAIEIDVPNKHNLKAINTLRKLEEILKSKPNVKNKGDDWALSYFWPKDQKTLFVKPAQLPPLIMCTSTTYNLLVASGILWETKYKRAVIALPIADNRRAWFCYQQSIADNLQLTEVGLTTGETDKWFEIEGLGTEKVNGICRILNAEMPLSISYYQKFNYINTQMTVNMPGIANLIR